MRLMRVQDSIVCLQICRVSWLFKVRTFPGTTIPIRKAHKLTAFSKKEIHLTRIFKKWVKHDSGYFDSTVNLWSVLMSQVYLEVVN